MKFLVIFISLYLFSHGLVKAEQFATTDSGELVILNQDGTWTYKDKSRYAKINMRHGLADQAYFSPSNTDKHFESKINNTGLRYSSEDWYRTNLGSRAAELELTHRDGNLFAMFIPEVGETSLQGIKRSIIFRMQKIDPDTEIDFVEVRQVNALPVLYLTVKATIENIEFFYRIYAYSSEIGTTQLYTYSRSQFAKEKEEMALSLLNGLVQK